MKLMTIAAMITGLVGLVAATSVQESPTSLPAKAHARERIVNGWSNGWSNGWMNGWRKGFTNKGFGNGSAAQGGTYGAEVVEIELAK